MTKILAFEADQTLGAEIQRQFQRFGCIVDVVGDGNTGLQRARTDHPDLILLTIELPEMNGFSVCNKLKKNPELRDIPVIILSRDSTSDTLERHRKLRTHAEDYLQKPFAFEELIARVNTLVSLSISSVEEEAISLDEDDSDVIELNGDSIDLVVEDEPTEQASSTGGSLLNPSDIDEFAESAFAAMQSIDMQSPDAPPNEPLEPESFGDDLRTAAMEIPGSDTDEGSDTPTEPPDHYDEAVEPSPVPHQYPSAAMAEEAPPEEISADLSGSLPESPSASPSEGSREGDHPASGLPNPFATDSSPPQGHSAPSPEQPQPMGTDASLSPNGGPPPLPETAIPVPAERARLGLPEEDGEPPSSEVAAPESSADSGFLEPAPPAAAGPSEMPGEQEAGNSDPGVVSSRNSSAPFRPSRPSLLSKTPPRKERMTSSAPGNPGPSEAEFEALQRELDEQKRMNARFLDEKEHLSGRVAQLDEKVAVLQKRESGGTGVSSREFLDLRESLNKKDRELLDLKDSLNRKEKSILDSRERRTALERELADQADRLLQLERKREELREQVRALTADQELLNGKMSTTERQLRSAEQDRDRLGQEVAEERQKRQEERSEWETTRQRLEATLDEQDEAHQAELALKIEEMTSQATATQAQALADQEAALNARREEELRKLAEEHRDAVALAETQHEEALAEESRRRKDDLQTSEDRLRAQAEASRTKMEALHQQALAEEERQRQDALAAQQLEADARHEAMSQEHLAALRQRDEQQALVTEERNEAREKCAGLEVRLSDSTQQLDALAERLRERENQLSDLEKRQSVQKEVLAHNERRIDAALNKISSDHESLDQAKQALAIALTLLADLPPHQDAGPHPADSQEP